MEEVESYIYKDLKRDISSIDYSIVSLDLERPAYTDPVLPFIFYNPDRGNLYTLTEEYFHALKKHHRRYNYDVLNNNESEAHNLALSYLFNKWIDYVGVNDWLQFCEALGVPCEHYDAVINMFKSMVAGF